MKTPFDKNTVEGVLRELGIKDISRATIRQTVAVSEKLEQLTGEKFVHLEMGSPGLEANKIGIQAQKAALDSGVASKYPNIAGITPLKNNASRFIKAFLDIDVAPTGCVPTVGSMMGTFASITLCCNLNPQKDTIVFLNPGFSVQPLQVDILGFNKKGFDIYSNRGEKLRDALENLLKVGNVAGILYSNPNNPSWVCLTEEELRYIGELATKYDAIVIEDLAYLGMDFRKDLGTPFEPPYQATVARYTDNYLLMLSASKIFSYAGERLSTVAISDRLFHRKYDNLAKRFGIDELGNAFIYVILYALSSGVSHSAQYALAAMYEAACDGKLNFVHDTSEYARRAKILKDIFVRNGFHIVYDKDLDKDVSDGFFFTIGRNGFTGDALVKELMYYGISSISLSTTGSQQQGIRVCTSMVNDKSFELLEERLALFNNNNKQE